MFIINFSWRTSSNATFWTFIFGRKIIILSNLRIRYVRIRYRFVQKNIRKNCNEWRGTLKKIYTESYKFNIYTKQIWSIVLRDLFEWTNEIHRIRNLKINFANIWLNHVIEDFIIHAVNCECVNTLDFYIHFMIIRIHNLQNVMWEQTIVSSVDICLY